jgi:hypothetical protein
MNYTMGCILCLCTNLILRDFSLYVLLALLVGNVSKYTHSVFVYLMLMRFPTPFFPIASGWNIE